MDWVTPVRVGTSVYEYLRDKILTGELPPGSRLAVPGLAKRLDVSRSPVRDAVLQLVREGLAVEELNRGAVVYLPTRGTLVSLYHAREAMEGMASRLAAGEISDGTLRELEVVLQEHERLEQHDFPRHIELDAHFHRTIRDAARSPVLAKMLEEIQGQVIVAMRSTNLSGGVRRATADHRAILEALERRDADGAEAAARAHISRLTRILEDEEEESNDANSASSQ